MTLWQRWQKVSLPNKLTILVAMFAAFLAALQVAAAGFQIWLANESSKDADKQTAKMIAAAERIARSGESVDVANQRNAAESLKQSREALAQSQLAMQESLSQAKRALDSSIRIARTDQRAWVYAGQTLLKKDVAVGDVRVEWSLFNSGKTPALNVRSKKAFEFSARVPESMEFTNWGQPTIVNPGQSTVTEWVRRAADAETVERYKAGGVNIVVKTLTCYEDIFGATHWVRRCMTHDHEQENTFFTYCATGNEVGTDPNGSVCVGYPKSAK